MCGELAKSEIGGFSLIQIKIIPWIPLEIEPKISSKIRSKISKKKMSHSSSDSSIGFSLKPMEEKTFRNYSRDSLGEFLEPSLMFIKSFFNIPTKNLSNTLSDFSQVSFRNLSTSSSTKFSENSFRISIGIIPRKY